MQILLSFLLALSSIFPTNVAQPVAKALTMQQDMPYEGTFHSEKYGVKIVINLYEADIIIPGYSFLGPVNGYMTGDNNNCLYGVWIITDFEIKANYARLRLSNDLGSESQTITLTPMPDGSMQYRALGANNVRKSQGRKLVKIVSEMSLDRISQER